MTEPLRNVAASVHQRLRNAAERSGERFNDLLQHYALERFLVRLAASPHRTRFVLKGALMLRVWKLARMRPTRDIDLLGRTANDPPRIAGIVREICTVAVDPDGLVFDPASVKVDRIALQSDYEGIRVSFIGLLARARLPMQIDIGFGDPVTPDPVEIEYPSVLGMRGARLVGYVPETTIAEKLHVMLERGTLNTRMKDFFDIWALSSAMDFDGRLLSRAVRTTCAARGTSISANPASFAPDALAAPDKQVLWSAFCRRLAISGAPETFAEVGRFAARFLAPVVEAVASGHELDRHWPRGGPWA